MLRGDAQHLLDRFPRGLHVAAGVGNHGSGEERADILRRKLLE